jgi:hypothetical protein
MMKQLAAVAAATVLFAPAAAGQSLLQRHDWQAPRLEAYLSAPADSVPWLDLATAARFGHRDVAAGFVPGRQALSLPPFRLQPQTQISSAVFPEPRRM